MAVLRVGGGEVSIGACAGRGGDFAGDLAALLDWGPRVVVSMVSREEMARTGAEGLPEALAGAGVGWVQCQVPDFGVPSDGWQAVTGAVAPVLAQGGRVHVHCMAGCGRSGAAVLRLMVEAGEAAPEALVRLRAVRPCAVETAAQYDWASRVEP